MAGSRGNRLSPAGLSRTPSEVPFVTRGRVRSPRPLLAGGPRGKARPHALGHIWASSNSPPRPRGPLAARTRGGHAGRAPHPRAAAPRGPAAGAPAPPSRSRALGPGPAQIRCESLCNHPRGPRLSPPPHLRQNKVKFKIETNYLASPAPRPRERGPRRRADPRPPPARRHP